MPRKEYHIQRTPIPDGYQIYEEWLQVAGVHHRRADVIAFITGRDPWLEFELDPNNPRDPNAIKVIGCTKGLLGPERRHIGYVPAELAGRIAKTGLRQLVRPRLWKTYLGDDGYVEVGFQLLGPVGHEARGAFGTSGRHARSSTGPFASGGGEYQFEWTTSGRLRVEVVHPRLGKRRVITGDSRSILEQMARMQIAEWERAAEAKERATRQREERAQGVETANERTREAEAAIAEAGAILAHTLTVNDAIDWDRLKDHSPFDRPEPEPPEIPREPQPDDEIYRPKLGIVGMLFRSVRETREAAARARFESDHEAWATKREQLLADHRQRLQDWQNEREAFLDAQDVHNELVEERRRQYLNRDPSAIVDYCNMVLANSTYPDWLSPSFEIDYLPESGTVIVDYQLPGIDALPRIKEVKYVASRNEFKESYLTESQLHKMYDSVVYQIVLRTVHELFEADTADALTAVVFNGWVRSVDRATGQEFTACIVSLHVTKAQFSAIDLAKVDPKQCFRALKGVGSAKLHSLTPVAPIMEISREDRRFVPSHAVADQLDEGYNLATMDWEDFEHLVRELFEKEFSQSGGEVKVTQASRDGGVDAIAFDPDPIRGGKIVIQAKRYTRTVGVSAVRDLYGTVVNEGATKGILVTTSDYGADAHEFAKGKPITLLNGAHLVHMLSRHGYNVRIDLEEARRLEKSGSVSQAG